jgi:hypothetical protein
VTKYDSVKRSISNCVKKKGVFLLFFLLHWFRPTKDDRLIRLVRRDMCTSQALFPLGIEPGIPRARPWNELLATGVQATWLRSDY